jgi:hypothetical protein
MSEAINVPRYPWLRFWIPPTAILDLSDGGFLRDPTDPIFGPGPLRKLVELEKCPALALLGEPGIGKSFALQQENQRLSALPPERGIRSVYVNLNGTSGEDRLCRQIFESSDLKAWKADNTRLYLLLDSLDEAMLRIETVPHLLAQEIQKLPTDRLCVRIACRTAVWPALTLGCALAQIWGESGYGVFELAPLRRCDVETALKAHGIEPNAFMGRLFDAQAVPFAIKPLTLKQQLRKVITDRTRQPLTRKTALTIAEWSELKELQPELLQAAQDQTEDPMARAAAVAALRRCGNATVPGQILAMLQNGLGNDPDAEIRGYALDLLWPNHINVDQLFDLLVPSNIQHGGSYATFLYQLPHTLPHRLKPEHLKSALTWVTAYVKRSGPTGEFREKTLADAIMFQAWEVFLRPDLTGLFLDHVAARPEHYGDLCRRTDVRAIKAFIEDLRTNTSRRRLFVRYLCEKAIDEPSAWAYIRTGFVTKEDFEWLLSISPGGSSPFPRLDEQSLCGFIRLLFKLDNNDQFEALYPVYKKWPLLYKCFAFLIDGMAIDSLSAVIEVKGCWNPELLTALDSQLVRNYMADLRAPGEIYLVGWFDQTHWDPDDTRRGQVRMSIEEARDCLEKQAAAVPDGFLVWVVVMDIRAP